VFQSHDLTFSRRQFEQCTFKRESIFRRYLTDRRENRHVIQTKASILSATDQLEASIPKNRVKPWVKLPRSVEPSQRVIGIEKGFLHSVERILTIRKDSERMSHRLGLVPLDKKAKRVPFTGLAPFDCNWVIHLPST
jgi:hypothetical protein